jgi:hypothetical protein
VRTIQVSENTKQEINSPESSRTSFADQRSKAKPTPPAQTAMTVQEATVSLRSRLNEPLGKKWDFQETRNTAAKKT